MSEKKQDKECTPRRIKAFNKKMQKQIDAASQVQTQNITKENTSNGSN